MSPFAKMTHIMGLIPNVDLNADPKSASALGMGGRGSSLGGSPMMVRSEPNSPELKKSYDVPIYLRIECDYYGSQEGHAWRITLKFDMRDKKKDNYVCRYMFSKLSIDYFERAGSKHNLTKRLENTSVSTGDGKEMMVVVLFETKGGHFPLNFKLFYAEDPLRVGEPPFEEWTGLDMKYMMRKLVKLSTIYVSNSDYEKALKVLKKKMKRR